MPTFFHTIEPDPGLTTINDDACELLQFSKLTLSKGERYEGTVPGDRETMLVLLSGKARVEVAGKTFASVGGRPNVFAGPPHSVYLSMGKGFTVTALTNLEAALPSAPSDLGTDPDLDIKPDCRAR